MSNTFFIDSKIYKCYNNKEKYIPNNIKIKKEVLIMEKYKFQVNKLNGFTLISLVVTIIILLILARRKHFNIIRKQQYNI